MPDEVRSLLTLHLVPGLGPRLTAALLERFGSASAILQAPAEELAEVPHIGDKLARQLRESMATVDVAAELERMERFHVRVLPRGGEGYPAPLTNIADPPPLLYSRGRWEERDANAVTIVGSRQCTSYGRRVAERLAAGLVQRGFTVISGLARGIDGSAHRGALDAGGRTVAVLAGGLSKIYPSEHVELAEQVQESGALLSEAPMGMQPLANMFPMRNRIMSGLARGVVIVEAAEQSGSLITARHAAEQGRAVFAVPGPVDSLSSGGTNALIRDGATLVRTADDIVEELDGVAAVAAPPTKAEPPPGLDEKQKRIWDCLAGQPRHVDELAQQLTLSVPELMASLLTLEMKRGIRRLSGNRYERA
jgi:DNA processing protein